MFVWMFHNFNIQVNKFQLAYCNLLKSNMDGLKRQKKQKTKKATQQLDLIKHLPWFLCCQSFKANVESQSELFSTDGIFQLSAFETSIDFTPVLSCDKPLANVQGAWTTQFRANGQYSPLRPVSSDHTSCFCAVARGAPFSRKPSVYQGSRWPTKNMLRLDVPSIKVSQDASSV